MKRTILTLLTLSTLVTACDEGPGETDSPAIAEDTQGIEALVSAWGAAWAAKDAAAFAANYTEDAEFIAPTGDMFAGREAIREQHAMLFNGPFAGSTATGQVRRTVFLTDTIALVGLNGELTGYAALPPGGLREARPGVLRNHINLVAVKRGGSWEILAQQMTAVAPSSLP